MMRRWKASGLGRVAGLAMLLVGLTMASRTLAAGEDWNDAQIKWMSYDDGLAEAKRSKRPVCLIFYTTWCPHCANYSKVFSNAKVVEKAKAFVMIRLDKDQHRDISKKYAPDGEYIPRTYFLSADGQLDASLSEAREQYKYFYHEKDPASILAGMDRALKKLR
jgi:protein-disulfide reductase (glutathione)